MRENHIWRSRSWYHLSLLLCAWLWMEAALLWVTMEMVSSSSVLIQVWLSASNVQNNSFFFLKQKCWCWTNCEGSDFWLLMLFVAMFHWWEGFPIFIAITGEMIKTPEILDVSILCLMWVSVNPDEAEPELLLAGGGDKRVRVLKRNERENGMLGTLETVGLLGAQLGAILALAQSSTYLATASGQCCF